MPWQEIETIGPVEPHELHLITVEAQEPTDVLMGQHHRPEAVAVTTEAAPLLQGAIEVPVKAQGAINPGAPRQVEATTVVLQDQAPLEAIAVAGLPEAVDPVA